MKICWDNLEKLEYRPDRDQWQDRKYKNIFYRYKENCKNCHEDFLSQKNKGLYCCHHCSTKREYNYIFTKEHKKKISEKRKGIKLSKEHKKKISNANKKENNHNWKNNVTKNNIPLYDTYVHQISYAEKTRRNEQDQNILEIRCAYCGKWFIPKRTNIINRIQALKGQYSNGTEHRLYCSNACKQECPIYKKKLWPKGFKINTGREVQPELRQIVFKRDNYTCQKCEKHQDELKVGLQCHHFEGVEINPIESADVDNCITLCKICHKFIHKIPCPYKDYKRKKC